MNQYIKNALGSLAVILAGVLIAYLAVEIKNQAKPGIDITKTASVVMSAEGKVTASPDTSEVIFSVVTEGEQAEAVQKQNDEKMSKVIDFLKNQGIEEKDIQTSGYNLYPRYNYNKPEGEFPEITGYTVNQRVTAKIRDLTKTSAIVGGLTSQGVNQIENISFYIDDPDALRSQARAQAIDKAKSKAEELARGLGVKLGKVINFAEGEFTGITPIYRGYPDGLGAGGGSPVQPGSQDVTVTVTLTFELK